MKEVIYLKSNNYEGIIQIRPRSKEVLDYVRNQVRKGNAVELVKEVFHPYGIDVYITSHRFARVIGRKLSNAFRNSEVKFSKKLHSQDRLTSKTLWRVTVLFRLKEETFKNQPTH